MNEKSRQILMLELLMWICDKRKDGSRLCDPRSVIQNKTLKDENLPIEERISTIIEILNLDGLEDIIPFRKRPKSDSIWKMSLDQNENYVPSVKDFLWRDR